MDLPFGLRIVCLVLFGMGAWSDLRSRSAPNSLWLTVGAAGVLALAAEAVGAGASILIGLVPLVGTLWALSFASFNMGFIGGADAKAVMVLPIAFPRVPGATPQSTIFGTLLQGSEAVMWVWIGTAVAGCAWVALDRLAGRDGEGLPFLVPLFLGVITAFVAG
jgi:Flp pilus assembly protein protease CpaA